MLTPRRESVKAVCEVIDDDVMHAALGEVMLYVVDVNFESDHVCVVVRLGAEPNRVNLAECRTARNVDVHGHTDGEALPLRHRDSLGEVEWGFRFQVEADQRDGNGFQHVSLLVE